MLRISFQVDPALREGLVWRALSRLEGAGDPGPLVEHHRRAGALYEIGDAAAREEAFAELAQREFHELGLLRPLEEALRERPALVARVDSVLLGEAQGRAQEGVTCDTERRVLGFRLQPSRFDDDALHGWCRHALGHAQDTLDPEFGFVPDWDAQPGVGGVAGRLHALWDVSVDGRDARAGIPVAGGEWRRHEAAIAALLPAACAPAAPAIVERLWEGARPTFRTLYGWASEIGQLAAAVGFHVAPDEDFPLPSGRCPLCSFPSEDLRVPPAELAARVAAEYPSWRRESGLCGRCADRYLLVAIPVGGRA